MLWLTISDEIHYPNPLSVSRSLYKLDLNHIMKVRQSRDAPPKSLHMVSAHQKQLDSSFRKQPGQTRELIFHNCRKRQPKNIPWQRLCARGISIIMSARGLEIPHWLAQRQMMSRWRLWEPARCILLMGSINISPDYSHEFSNKTIPLIWTSGL